MIILETKDLTKTFGGLVAVDRVNLAIPQGTIKGIIGPNGAGKTTLFNLISGVISLTRGKILYRGEDITHYPPHVRSHKGISRSFQVTSIFPNLTVLENVRIAVQSRMKARFNYNFLADVREADFLIKKALGYIHEVGLKGKELVLARDLPHADQRKLELAISMATEPQLLLLDEPTAGLAIEEIPEIINVIKRLKEARKELTILMIEHKMDVISKIADTIIVMFEGRVIADGKPEEIARNELVQRAYLGGEVL